MTDFEPYKVKKKLLTWTSSSRLMTQGRFCIVSTKAFSSARVIFPSLQTHWQDSVHDDQSCTSQKQWVFCVTWSLWQRGAQRYSAGSDLRLSEPCPVSAGVRCRGTFSPRLPSLVPSAPRLLQENNIILPSKGHNNVHQVPDKLLTAISHLFYSLLPVRGSLWLCWPSDQRTRSEPSACEASPTTRPGCICTCDVTHKTQDVTQDENQSIGASPETPRIPEVEFISRAVAQILGVVETHQPLGAVGAGQSREEARGLAFVTLSLVIGQQFKRLTLGFGDTLQGRETNTFHHQLV